MLMAYDLNSAMHTLRRNEMKTRGNPYIDPDTNGVVLCRPTNEAVKFEKRQYY